MKRDITLHISRDDNNNIQIYYQCTQPIVALQFKISNIRLKESKVMPLVKDCFINDIAISGNPSSFISKFGIGNQIFLFNTDSQSTIKNSNSFRLLLQINSDSYDYVGDGSELCINSVKTIDLDRQNHITYDQFCEISGVIESNSARDCDNYDIVNGSLEYSGKICNVTIDKFYNWVDKISIYKEWFKKYNFWLTGSFAYIYSQLLERSDMIKVRSNLNLSPMDLDVVVVPKNKNIDFNPREIENILKTFMRIGYEEANIKSDVYYVDFEVWPKRVKMWERHTDTNVTHSATFLNFRREDITSGISFGKKLTVNNKVLRHRKESDKIENSNELYAVNSVLVSQKQAARIARMKTKKHVGTPSEIFVEIGSLL